MKGLIYKDLLLLKQVVVSMAFLSVFYLALSHVGGGEVNYFPIMAMIINMMSATSCSGYDERCDWNSFGCSLPVSRTQIVISRYITNILIIIVTSLLVFASDIFYTVVYGLNINLFEVFIIIFVSMFMLSIINPITYKFDMNKSRIIVAATLVIVSVASSFLVVWFILSHDIPEINLNVELVAAVVFAVCIAIYVLSAMLSISIYKKKEF